MEEKKCLVCGVPFTQTDDGEWVDPQGVEVKRDDEGEPLFCKPCVDNREGWWFCNGCVQHHHENFSEWVLLDKEKYCHESTEGEAKHTVEGGMFHCRRCGYEEKTDEDDPLDECPKCG